MFNSIKTWALLFHQRENEITEIDEVREDEEEGERDEGIKVVDTLVPLPDCEMTLKMLIYSPVHPSLLHLTLLFSPSASMWDYELLRDSLCITHFKWDVRAQLSTIFTEEL